MSSIATTTPIVRQHSWRVALPSLVVLGAAVGLGFYLGDRLGAVVAICCYLAYSQAARGIVAWNQRRGIACVRRNGFEEAIEHFQRSFEFFERHRWIDEWRGLVLLSSSRGSYREMALVNIAFCHTQEGRRAEAIEFYRRCLELFPNSGMAQAGLKTLTIAESTEE